MKEPVTIKDICSRYKCHRKLGEKIMAQLPHFKAGRTLTTYAEYLEKWEMEQMVYPMPKGVRQPKQPIPFVIPRKKAQ